MTLPLTGIITAQMINLELGRAADASFNLNDAVIRALAEKPTGAISLSDFYGKSNETVINAPLGNGANRCSEIFNGFEPGLWESNKKKRLRITGERNSLRIDTQYGGEFTLELTPSGILSGGTWAEGLAIDTGVTRIVPVINNGIIRGRGGNGGVGGQGGNGNYPVNFLQREPASGHYFDRPNNQNQTCWWQLGGRVTLYWNWNKIYDNAGHGSNTFADVDGWRYFKGPQGGTAVFGIWREQQQTRWETTYGGSGGAGGVGVRYGAARTNGQSGSAGGQNAGAGGKGGDGGDWGQSGGAGATGSAGNVSGGLAGSPGERSVAIWGAQRVNITGVGKVLGVLLNN